MIILLDFLIDFQYKLFLRIRRFTKLFGSFYYIRTNKRTFISIIKKLISLVLYKLWKYL